MLIQRLGPKFLIQRFFKRQRRHGSIPGSARQLAWKIPAGFQWKKSSGHLQKARLITGGDVRINEKFPPKTFMALSENGVYSQLYSH